MDEQEKVRTEAAQQPPTPMPTAGGPDGIAHAHGTGEHAHGTGAPDHGDGGHGHDAHDHGAPDHGGHVDDAHDHGGHEFQGLRHAFKERAIAFHTMDKPLRLMAGLAVVQLLIAAVLIPLRDLHLPSMPVYVVDEHLVQSPVLIYITALVLLSLSWGYLLTGILHAHPVLRLIGLGAFTWAMELVHPAVAPPGLETAWYALLAVPWVVGLWSIVRDVRAFGARAFAIPRRRMPRPLRWPVALLVTACALALYGVSFLGNRYGSETLLFTNQVTLQLSTLQFVLIPVLFLAGVDFAEWGEMSMERVSLSVKGRKRPVVSLLAAAGGALIVLGIIAYNYRHALFVSHHIMPLVIDGLWGLLALGLLALLARGIRFARGLELPLHLPYRALVAMTLLYAGLMFTVTFATTVPATQRAIDQVKAHPRTLPMTTYRHETAPVFTLDYPDTWLVQTYVDAGLKKPLILAFNGLAAGNPGALYLVRTSPAGERTFQIMRRDWFLFCCKKYTITYDHPQRVGGWQVIHYTELSRGKPLIAGRLWYLAARNAHWLLQDMTALHLQAFDAPIFEHMALSLHAGRSAAAAADKGAPADTAASSGAPTDSDRLAAVIAATFAVLTVVFAALLIRRGRKGRGGMISAALLFGVVFGLYSVLAGVNSFSIVFLSAFGPLGHLQHMTFIGVQIGVAVATLVGVVWALVTGRTAKRWGDLALLALVLNGSLQILSWIYDLFTGAMDVSGRFSVAQAVVIIVALTWDVVMSGETVTNREGAIFPRSSRVLLFFGYMAFVACNLAYFSTLQIQATGVQLEAQFESEFWVQSGIITLGVPLLLALFLLRVGRWMRGAGAEQAPAHAAPGDAHAMSAPAPQPDEEALPRPA